MIQQKIQHRSNAPVEYHCDKPFYTVPRILRDVVDESGRVTHYLCEGNRLFVKEAYDFNFLVKVEQSVKRRHYNKRPV